MYVRITGSCLSHWKSVKFFTERKGSCLPLSDGTGWFRLGSELSAGGSSGLQLSQIREGRGVGG